MFSPSFLHQLVMPTLIIAQWCGLFPVIGITAVTSCKLRFTWYNYRFLYCMVVWIAMFINLYVTWQSEQADDTPLSILNAKLLDVVGSTLFFLPIFLRISYKWSKFVHKWEVIEKKNPAYQMTKRLGHMLRLILIIFIGTKIGFIFVKLITLTIVIAICLQFPSVLDQLATAFSSHYYKIFRITQPAPWKYTALFTMEIITTLQWASCNLLITVLSVILTARFKEFNNHLEAFKTQLMPSKYWQDMRDSYAKLSELTMLLDELLSPLILVTFIMDTLNIIIYIYWVISNVKDVIKYILAFFRCLKIVLVSFITQFAVSTIYEESKRPLGIFNQVPSASYCREVKRLYEQVSTDTLALSGYQFFFVTRSVILTMLSTIVTYEVVLIQFGSYEPHSSISNSTISPYCHEWILPNHTKHQ